MRFSNASHNIHFSFQNDFSIGLFKGSGTDYGVTGSLDIGFTNIRDVETVQKFGFGIDLFTARPNYSIAQEILLIQMTEEKTFGLPYLLSKNYFMATYMAMLRIKRMITMYTLK